MISFVLGVYSGLTVEPGNGKRGGSRSYPSDFMDDHGPPTCLDDTFRETVSIPLRLIHATIVYCFEQLYISASIVITCLLFITPLLNLLFLILKKK